MDRGLRAGDADPDVHIMFSDGPRLTKEETEEFKRELTSLKGTWRRRTMGSHDDRHTDHLLEIMLPIPDLECPQQLVLHRMAGDLLTPVAERTAVASRLPAESSPRSEPCSH